MTLSFKDQVARDFKNVFMNKDELGHECVWDGRQIVIVECATPALVSDGDETGGLIAVTKTVICQKSDLGSAPTRNSEIVIDGIRWRILMTLERLAHYEITLARLSA